MATPSKRRKRTPKSKPLPTIDDSRLDELGPSTDDRDDSRAYGRGFRGLRDHTCTSSDRIQRATERQLPTGTSDCICRWTASSICTRLEEDGGHVLVIGLAGVHQHLPHARGGAQRPQGEIPDDWWVGIKPILEKLWPRKLTGRRHANWRWILNGIIFRMRSSCQWDQLPRQFGPKSTVHDWFQRWCVGGVMKQI